MAIDFEEQVEPKISLAICSSHNLKYDPEVTWGCVLCRTQRKRRVSGYWVVAVIFAIAAGIYYLLPVLRPQTEPSLAAVVKVGDSTVDSESNQANPRVSCLFEMSRKIEQCVAKVDIQNPNARMDKEFCLNRLQESNGHCAKYFGEQNYLSEPLYSVHNLPKWQQIRTSIEERQADIEKCVGGANYAFSVRVQVDRRTGIPQDVTLSLFGLNTSERFCLYKFFESLEFPGNELSDYTFVTRIESSLLARNRPQQKNNRESDFQQALQKQRKARLYEERHAEIMKKREEFDRKFKSDMKR
ncbi:MAG: hypothetical protein JXR76_00150 [Deltaproteobacteria bacterium]|nr:hypothetical protein [Deltaproteobacteria bacterium]